MPGNIKSLLISSKNHNRVSSVLFGEKLGKFLNLGEKIFNENKIFYLPDPVIEIKKFVDKKKENIQINENTRLIVAIGRLTKQKNFSFLIVLSLLKKNNTMFSKTKPG